MGFVGLLAFIVALLFSVMVHEFGHFITARKFGMKVTEFFLGFGKRIWSFKRGETEFGVKAIPAGGYCRIVGMSVNETLTAEEKPRAFYIASVPKRLIVLVSGSLLHFVLGFLLLALLVGGVGFTSSTNKIGEVVANSPAQSAGLKAGDEVKTISGKKISDWSKAVDVIRPSIGKELTLTVLRDGEIIEIKVTPAGKVFNGKKIGVIGVTNKLGTKRLGPLSTVTTSARITKDLVVNSVSSLVALPSKIPALVRQTLGKEKRDSAGLVGVVGVARVSAETASDPKLATREKISNFILIIASLNIFVGIFNLLPLLPLDGGHMAVAYVDGIRRWRAKRKGQAAPNAIDVERLLPITLVVFTLLAGLSLLLLAADIFHPISLNQ